MGKRGNFFTNLFLSLIKRELLLVDIKAVTYSIHSNHFLLHLPDSYDYLLKTRNKDEFLQIFIFLKTKNVNKVIFYLVESIDLIKYCQLEGDKEKKWPSKAPS